MSEKLIPSAMWTNDCQGKKDYDGRLMSISCRYWPGEGEGGFMQTNVKPGAVEITEVPYGKFPTAHAAIHLQHGVPDAPDGFDDYVTYREAHFSGATEEEVKQKVEQWVQEQMEALVKVLGL